MSREPEHCARIRWVGGSLGQPCHSSLSRLQNNVVLVGHRAVERELERPSQNGVTGSIADRRLRCDGVHRRAELHAKGAGHHEEYTIRRTRCSCRNDRRGPGARSGRWEPAVVPAGGRCPWRRRNGRRVERLASGLGSGHGEPGQDRDSRAAAERLGPYQSAGPTDLRLPRRVPSRSLGSIPDRSRDERREPRDLIILIPRDSSEASEPWMAAESGRAGAHRSTVELTALSAHDLPRSPSTGGCAASR